MTTEQFNFMNHVRTRFMVRYHFNDVVSTWFAALFALESHFGNSALAKTHHNLCSMKLPRVRISVATNFGLEEVWACYKDSFDCILDFVLWLQYQKPMRKELESPELLYSYFRKYCPEKDYIDKINLIVKSFNSCTYER